VLAQTKFVLPDVKRVQPTDILRSPAACKHLKAYIKLRGLRPSYIQTIRALRVTMAIAEDAATVLELFIHDGILQVLRHRDKSKLTTNSRKPSRRDYASLRGDAGQRSTNTRVARRDSTA
jgi:hypothetical protein